MVKDPSERIYRACVRCDKCGEELYDGDIVYEIDGELMCAYCAEDYFQSNYSRILTINDEEV